jgi:hypothetical protein
MRKCLNCHKSLARRETEKRAEFLGRKYCDLKCSIADRPRVNAEKRAALDLKDQEAPPVTGGLTFTHQEILHRAHMAAPQIPISILDAVIKDVEPMLSANVRHQLLGPIAARIRAQRAS